MHNDFDFEPWWHEKPPKRNWLKAAVIAALSIIPIYLFVVALFIITNQRLFFLQKFIIVFITRKKLWQL